MSVYLEEMLSGWDQQERNKVNENWRRIMATFTNLQRQINILAGGEEVNELLQRLNDAVDSATIAVQEAIDANNTATQDAITANNQALQIALNTIGDALTDVGNAIQAAETATNDAMEAKDAALQAAGDAQITISQMQVIISNFRPRGEWNATTDYFKNNLAGLNGKTYIALQNNTNKPVTDTSFWMLFADRGAKGERGEKGEPGTGIKVLGHFNDVSELPQNPTLGDAYTIGADRDLYVYNGNDWQNLGSIKGVEGKSAYEVAVENGFVGTEIEWLETLIGPPGPDGPPGPPADLTEINQKVDDLQTEVTEHLAQSNINAHKIGNIDGLQTALEEIADSQMTVNGKAIEYNGDYNLLRKSGWYNGSQSWGAKNLPPTGPASYLVEVIAWSGYNEGSVTQFARSLNKPEVTWFRQGFANGNWNPWTRVTDKLYNIYVDPANGLDEDGKGWSNGANAYKTLGYALGKLPRLSGYETTLTLAAGTYSTLNLSNYRGGLLTVRGAGATTVIDWVMFSHIDNLQLRDFNAVMGLDLRVVNNFSIQNVNSPYGTDGHGVYCLASSGMISMSTYSSKTSGAGIKLDNGSNVVLDTVSGSGNKIGIDVELSICRRRASSITGTTPTRALNGGQIL
ncbi:pyocin knob domain-containing protein [Lysinibacillus capsici]|uniref:pyocin knob domain-containing protein n=1 Tax=Lysinibacillus capsici TaxID=2115968 RepID=UPI002E1F137E|nr:pyocin knob domain-containing protein [Lysinibacillus capsici]